MEYQKIKSPKTNRLIYIHGDAYNKLKNDYTEDYLLSLPRITSNKQLSPKYKTNLPVITAVTVQFNTEVIFEIALNLKYFDILKLCNINKNYNLICKDQHFWKVKYNNDFKEYNEARYLKESAYTKKWFPRDFKTFDEYN